MLNEIEETLAREAREGGETYLTPRGNDGGCVEIREAILKTFGAGAKLADLHVVARFDLR